MASVIETAPDTEGTANSSEISAEALGIDIAKFIEQIQRAKVRWKKIPLAKRQQYMQKAEAVVRYLSLRENNNNRAPDKTREVALGELKAFGVQSIQTLYNLMDRWTLFRILFPGEKFPYALVKLPGPPKKRILTEEQELLVIGAYLYADWKVIIGDKVKRSRDRVQTTFIHSMLTQLYPDLKVTVEQLDRFIRQKKAEEHVLFTLGREGSRKIWQDFMPKTHNDVGEPNIRWQSDGRVLPVYVLFKKRKKVYKCTVTLVFIIDDYSLRVLNWALIPRLEEDESGKLVGADFKNEHVRLLFAGAMAELGVRPRFWYTDNGAQFKAIAEFIGWLTQRDEQEIIPIFGFPGHPWSRGKVEVVGKLVNKVLRKLSGFVKDEDDTQEWKKARRATDVEFDDLEVAIKAYFDGWNANVTRLKRWSKEHVALTAPSEDRLVHFATAESWGEASITDQGILIEKGVRYKPAEMEYNRWMAAVGQGSVRYCMLPTTHGNHYLATLDGDTWERIIPTTEALPARREHVEEQWASLNAEQVRLHELRKQFREISERLYGGVPLQNIADDNAILPSQVPTPKQKKAPKSDAPVAESPIPPARQPTPPPAEEPTPPTPPSRRRQVNIFQRMEDMKKQRRS